METDIQQATAVIQSGGVILYPTDTIWGIGCDATNSRAVQRIYDIKRREDSKSMLVLCHSPQQLQQYTGPLSAQAQQLMAKTTRPLTIIYPQAMGLSSRLLAADGSVGIRLTADTFCRQLIQKSGVPLVSTSANFSGQPHPPAFKAIDKQLLKLVDYVVQHRQNDEQPARPSTIVKLLPSGEILTIRA